MNDPAFVPASRLPTDAELAEVHRELDLLCSGKVPPSASALEAQARGVDGYGARRARLE